MLRTFMLFKAFEAGDYKDDDELARLLHRIRQVITSKEPKDEEDKVKRCSAQHRYLFFLELYRDANEQSDPPKLELNIPKEIDDLQNVLKKLHREAEQKTSIDYEFGEREHARWYIERWLQGTRFGDNKIDKNVPLEQRTNPCMSAWYDLKEDIILRDTEFLLRYQVAKVIEGETELSEKINQLFPESTPAGNSNQTDASPKKQHNV